MEKAVPLAAAHLGISEFELFYIAYRGWFKRSGEQREISHYLETFHTQGSAPYWLEHYIYQLDARTHFLGYRYRKAGHPRLWLLLFVSPGLSTASWILGRPKDSKSDVLVC